MAIVSAAQTQDIRPVRWWLIAVAALIAVMVLVGGATRLTKSGLSIVEWKPVTGALPPLGETAWTQAFDAYKRIPQYRQMNAGMSLGEFKTIFWWEWSHRLLGRVIGMAYLLPFLWFLWRGGLGGELKRRLWGIFALGALQGAVGWWMVASGLSERVEVSQYRLATHLVLALLIFAGIVWTLRRLGESAPSSAPPRLKITRDRSARADVRTALSRCAGGGASRRQDLQHLARYRRRFHSIGRTVVLRCAVVAQPVRKYADRAVRTPHGGLYAVCAGGAGMRSTPRAPARARPAIDGALWLAAAS